MLVISFKFFIISPISLEETESEIDDIFFRIFSILSLLSEIFPVILSKFLIEFDMFFSLVTTSLFSSFILSDIRINVSSKFLNELAKFFLASVFKTDVKINIRESTELINPSALFLSGKICLFTSS